MITTASFPKSLYGGTKMKAAKKTSKSNVMKQDKALDKKMTPKQLASDIQADKKLLKQKLQKAGKKK